MAKLQRMGGPRVVRHVIVAGITLAMLTTMSVAATTKAELKAERQAIKLAEKQAKQIAKQEAKLAKQAEKLAKQASRNGTPVQPVAQPAPLTQPEPVAKPVANPVMQPGVEQVEPRPAPPPAMPPARIQGANPDLNGDGVVDAQDVKLFNFYMKRGFDPNGPNLDINGDGLVNDNDLIALLQLIGENSNAIDKNDAAPPPGQPVMPVEMNTRLVDGNKIEMIDAVTGAYVIKPNGQRLWSGSNTSTHPTSVSPTIQMIPVTDGFDVVYTFTNNTGAMAGLGKFTVGGFRFGQIIEAHDFRFDGKPYEIDNRGGPLAPGGWFYPSGQYSPVVVFGEAPYKVSVSLHYPILEYKHQVRLRIATPGGAAAQSGLNWSVDINLNPENNDNKFNPDGDLHPGETRTYVVAVRVVKGGTNWISTLEPYRNYFQALYGGVRYTRDARPVNARSAAQHGNQDSNNPYGFGHGNLRPDIFGWAPWVDRLVDSVDTGWSRFMLWRPTGLFENHFDMQNPFLFTSHWFEGNNYGHNMGNALQEFPRVGAAGGQLGLWWGSSARVMREWNTDQWEPLEVHNPEHQMLAFKELDNAVAAGVRIIGLDAFRRLQPWDAWDWLTMLKRRAPNVTFVTEPPCGDVIHLLAPAFLVATRPANQIQLRLNQPHALADYLVPGHETWGLIRRDRLTSALGKPPTDADVQAEVARVAALGYVPCVGLALDFSEGGEGDRFMAAETWNTDD